MYITELPFPQFTNREDFYQLISFYDELTDEVISLSGITLANSALPFTSSAWTVTCGSIATTSATTITIPTMPIGSQLSALTLTVAPALGILQGSPVTIADTATGNNRMLGYVTSYSANTGTLVCQIGWTFQFEIRGDVPNNAMGGFVTWYDFGSINDQGPILRATLDNYISIVDIGVVQIEIPEVIFKTVLDAPYSAQSNTYARTLLACMTMTDSVHTRQLFRGRLPVLFGGVTT